MGAESSSNCLNICQASSQRSSLQTEIPAPIVKIHTVNKNVDCTVEQKPLLMEKSEIKNQMKKSIISVSTETASSVMSSSIHKKTDLEQYSKKKLSEFQAVQPQSKLSISDYKILSMLGRGNFSKVILASRNSSLFGQSSSMSAIKVIRKEEVQNKEVLKSLKLEKDILKLSRSPFIPQLHGAFSDNEYYYIAMQWAEGGDCYSLIKKGSKRQPMFQQAGQKALRFLLGCVILGLEELHNQGILFADLKPENVLLFKDGYAKLTDFGLSKKLAHGEKISVYSGSPLYIAPEVTNKDKCGLQLDLWTLGILAYELSNGATPFSAQAINRKKIFPMAIENFHSKKVWHNKKASFRLKDLVHSLLRLSPSERLGANGFSEIKSHAFFKVAGFDWDELANKRMQSPLLPILAEKIEQLPASDANLSIRVQQFSQIQCENN